MGASAPATPLLQTILVLVMHPRNLKIDLFFWGLCFGIAKACAKVKSSIRFEISQRSDHPAEMTLKFAVRFCQPKAAILSFLAKAWHSVFSLSWITKEWACSKFAFHIHRNFWNPMREIWYDQIRRNLFTILYDNTGMWPIRLVSERYSAGHI